MEGERAALYDSPPREDDLRDMIARWLGTHKVPKRLRVVQDTTDFFRVDYDDVVVLEGHPYLIRNYEREGRFGIDEEPKFWVRRAIDLLDGRVKILKMVFHESFNARVGGIEFRCVRSPRKEAGILDIVKGHPNFMQGKAVRDASGNIIRIIDFIKGGTLADYVLGLGADHREYFERHFPLVLDQFVDLVGAIRFLHEHGEKHGDIRRDHIIREKDSGLCRWIDFDFDYMQRESMYGYDLFGLGNVLAYLVGRGDVTVQGLRRQRSQILDNLGEDDMNIVFANRVMNLKKIYPYIPDSLSFILLHFSNGAEEFYEDTRELLEDLEAAKKDLAHEAG